MAVPLADDDVAELGDRPTRPRVRSVIDVAPCSTRPPGISAFCVCSARETSVDGEVVGAQAVGVERDVDLPRAAADDHDLADAADALELPAQRLVGVLGDVADRLLRRDRERQDRRRIGIELLDRRLVDRLRQQRQHAVDAVAHLLRGDVGVLLEQERDRSPCETPSDEVERSSSMPLIVLTASSILSVISVSTSSGAAPGSRVVTTTVGKSTFGKRSRPSWREGERADDRQREDEDAREDRTLDGDCC